MRGFTRLGLTPTQLSFRFISRGYSSNVADVPYRDFLATDHFQPSLPRLKVPPLEMTIERYINSQKALLSESELDKTSGLANKFLTDRGPQLQRELMEYARVNSHTSYITDLWFDMYLSDRRPVVLTHNPVMVLQNTSRGPGYQQVCKLLNLLPAVRATNLIFGAIRFRQLLSSNKLEPEVFHLNPRKSKTPLFYRTVRWVPKSVATYAAYMFNAYPLDMSQYPSMFNSTRIPKPGKDSLFRNTSARHLLVIHRGQFYVFDVFDVNGDPVSPKQVLSNIQFILSRPPVCTAPGLGVITTMNRDEAYVVRKRLIALGNRANLDLIDSALLALVLDDEPQMDIKSTVSFFFFIVFIC
ncbi:Carnitine palmitoyltransferase 2 [Paragonimus heterotremus]|uniref:Carnitine palmitoyltransferase 2 n=1 Tax=Paragonimus heterotremus TaxID=100268 RepID=A0A8J4T9Q2_9TREM|nr:Carnitine palmitoyltransferase 2 [Paragonimus heterotremus]